MPPTYDELLAENVELKTIIHSLKATIKSLQDRIAELETKINQNSKNSSKPSSTDRKPNIQRRERQQSRSYHPGANRHLLPENMVTSLETRYLEKCPRCHNKMEPIGIVSSWQQIDLPIISPLVHQIDLALCRCPCCRLEAGPELTDAEQFLLGPRLEAFVNLMLGQYRLGHRSVRTLIELILPGINLSQGLISKIKARTAQLLSAPYEGLTTTINTSTAPLHVDATGWRHQGINEHLLVMRVGNIISYAIVSHQNGTTISQTLGGRVNCLVVDRGLAVAEVKTKIKQYCLAHLIRNVKGQAEHPLVSRKDTDRLGGIYDTLQELFVDKHRAEGGEISQSSWQHYGYAKWRYIVEELEELSLDGSTKKLRKFCSKLLRQIRHFRAYLKDPKIPMTNNLAEEALRNLVIARKLCFGSRSLYGKKWREAFHSCLETLRRNGKSVLDFLTEAIKAVRSGSTIPSIV